MLEKQSEEIIKLKQTIDEHKRKESVTDRKWNQLIKEQELAE